jgi:hypothetical protein
MLEGNVTTNTQQVRTKSFYFDMACTSHMAPFPERLQNYTTCSGLVESSSKQYLQIKGKGDIRMDCVLKDGLVSKFCSRNVLYVLQLGGGITYFLEEIAELG